MRLFFFALVFISFVVKGYSQCDIKTTHRLDGIMKYFTPKPVVRVSKYEVGLSLYYNEQIKQYTLASFVLYKESSPKVLEGNLVVQTNNTNGISLKPYLHNMIEMNGHDVAASIYYLQQNDINEFKKYPLKTIAFTVDGKIVGLAVTDNQNILKYEFECLKNSNLMTNDNSNTEKIIQDTTASKGLDILKQSINNSKHRESDNIFEHNERRKGNLDLTEKSDSYENPARYVEDNSKADKSDKEKWYIEDTLIKLLIVLLFAGVIIVLSFKLK